MRGRTVLILLVLVVGLVAFIELYEHELPSTEERAALDKLVLVTEPDEISAVELAWGESHLRLERQEVGSAWRLVEPMSARADDDLAASFIESLTTLQKRRTLEDAMAEDVGLNPPRLIATVFAGDRSEELWFGSEVPAGKSMIVSLKNSSEIFVVDNSIWPDLIREPGEWRSKQVLDVGQGSVETVTLVREGQRLVLGKQGSDFWLEEPVADQADAQQVGDLLAALASMQVVSFIDDLPESLSELGLDPAVGEVEITTGDSAETWQVEWGNPLPGMESQYYARSEDQVFSTEAPLMQYFEMPVAQWRSLDVISLETFQIDVLEVAQEGRGVMLLERDGANWLRNEDEISFTSVSDLLYAITGARAASVLTDPEVKQTIVASSKPSLELLVRGGEGEQGVTLYSLDEGGAHAVAGNRDVVLLVGQDEFTEILAKAGEVRAAISIKTDIDDQLPLESSEVTPDQ